MALLRVACNSAGGGGLFHPAVEMPRGAPPPARHQLQLTPGSPSDAPPPNSLPPPLPRRCHRATPWPHTDVRHQIEIQNTQTYTFKRGGIMQRLLLPSSLRLDAVTTLTLDGSSTRILHHSDRSVGRKPVWAKAAVGSAAAMAGSAEVDGHAGRGPGSTGA